MDRKVVEVVFFGAVAIVAVVTSPAECSECGVAWRSATQRSVTSVAQLQLQLQLQLWCN